MPHTQHFSWDAILKWLIWVIGTFCVSSNSILSNSTAEANWPLDKARKRNGGCFPGRHATEEIHLLWLRMGRTKAFPLPVLPRGLLDDRTTPELLSAPVGQLTRAVPASPMALLCYIAGEPAWAAQVPAAMSYSSLALQRCWPVKNHCHLPPGAAPGKSYLSEVYGLSRSSVSVLACMSHRARRTGCLKLAHLVVLAALKTDLKIRMVCNNTQQMTTVTFCQIKRRLVKCSIKLKLGIGKLLI